MCSVMKLSHWCRYVESNDISFVVFHYISQYEKNTVTEVFAKLIYNSN